MKESDILKGIKVKCINADFENKSNYNHQPVLNEQYTVNVTIRHGASYTGLTLREVPEIQKEMRQVWNIKHFEFI